MIKECMKNLKFGFSHTLFIFIVAKIKIGMIIQLHTS